MTTRTFTRAGQVRQAFWQGVPKAWRKRQSDGDYCTDCRCEFVRFVDMPYDDRWPAQGAP